MGPREQQSTAAIAHGRLLEVPRITLPDEATRSMLDGLAGLHALVLAVDSELRVIWLSDDLGLIHGGAAKSVGRPVSSLLDELWPNDVSAFGNQTRQVVDEMIAKGRVSAARFDLRQDGRALPLEVSAFRVRDRAQNDFVICVADRRQTQASLAQKNEELESYVRSVSHDLRSPLVSLLGFSQLLRNDYHEILNKTGLHFLDRIEQAGRHMERLLHDMRALTRIEETSHCRVYVHPTPILRQLVSELKLQLDEKNIELQIPEDPPAVLCDRTRLYQLFLNLIGNAIAHMQVKSMGRIEVEIETVPDGWLISVRDNGRGIRRADHERIFEAFETAAGQPREGKENSGLGLAIVKKIVAAHSGRVWVESEPGAGACFFVWLPQG